MTDDRRVIRNVEELGYKTAIYVNGVIKSSSFKNKDGDLVGSIELPLALGLVGGATAIHPMAKLVLKILGVKTSLNSLCWFSSRP